MRCLTLARAWQDRGGAVAALTAGLPDDVASRYRRHGIEVQVTKEGTSGSHGDAVHLAEHAVARGAAWLVIDDYGLGTAFQETLHQRTRLLVIDDHGRQGRYAASVVLDQNVGVDCTIYASRPSTSTLLLGPRFALVSPAFRDVARRPRGGQAESILIILGGGPPPELVDLVAEAAALLTAADLEVVVVSPPPALRGPSRVRWVDSTGEMPEWMRAADVCLAAAGTTSSELCCAGLPALLFAAADNQVAVARGWASAGAAVDLGGWELLTPTSVCDAIRSLAADESKRLALAAVGMRLVDGRGAQRVVDELWPRLRLRPATEGDGRLLWEWANDPRVRAASFSSAPIPWAGHLSWLQTRLASRETLIFIAVDETQRPVGQIRVERRDGAAEVAFSVAPQARGEGHGPMLVRSGVAHVFAQWPDVERVVAVVKTDNPASVATVQQAGFQPGAHVVIDGNAAVRWSQSRAEFHVRR